MADGTRICKICGKEYPYCFTMTANNGNRWQDVGCCIEHATQYFKEVAIARGELVEDEPAEKKSAPAPKKASSKKAAEVKEDEISEPDIEAE